jgi:hypothetical protein
VQPHGHLTAERFDFKLARNTGIFVCRRVMEGAPVLHVSHDKDGDWQFLCGGDQHGEGGSDHAAIQCLECTLARDPSLNELADLCGDWSADRDALVWPDKNSRFPGDPDANATMAKQQPLPP